MVACGGKENDEAGVGGGGSGGERGGEDGGAPIGFFGGGGRASGGGGELRGRGLEDFGAEGFAGLREFGVVRVEDFDF